MKFAKVALILLILFISIRLSDLWYKTFIVGGYYVSAPIHLTLLGVLVPIVFVVLVFFLIIKIVKFDLNPDREL